VFIFLWLLLMSLNSLISCIGIKFIAIQNERDLSDGREPFGLPVSAYSSVIHPLGKSQ
jgi:hypothetical protein